MFKNDKDIAELEEMSESHKEVEITQSIIDKEVLEFGNDMKRYYMSAINGGDASRFAHEHYFFANFDDECYYSCFKWLREGNYGVAELFVLGDFDENIILDIYTKDDVEEYISYVKDILEIHYL